MATKEKVEDKVIPVKQSELNEILEQNRKLIALLSEKEAKPTLTSKGVKERKVTIMFIDGKPVTGYVNKGLDHRPNFIYEAPDPKNARENLLYVDLILDNDLENPVRVNYLEFLEEADRQECLVTKIEEEAWYDESAGTVEAQSVKEGEWHAELLGMRVPLVVEGKIRTFTVRLPNGEEGIFDERYVNIAK